ncbi:hypothetical protein FSP39_019401 [Pinctada imbricata]|uniref:Uncharacterized protein n=1 Tax=Pinctada imbricata TaxID=66713 RepID=A0AA89BRG9_PINIB|nr:hypothetical protein FSP39_019401 [Pinctada imbricata]
MKIEKVFYYIKNKSNTCLKYVPDAKRSEEKKAKNFRIPLDGNLIDFSEEDMEIFFRHNGVNTHVIQSLKRKGVNGRKFAAMTDGMLEVLGMKTPIILYFRERCKPEKDQFIL